MKLWEKNTAGAAEKWFEGCLDPMRVLSVDTSSPWKFLGIPPATPSREVEIRVSPVALTSAPNPSIPDPYGPAQDS